MGARCPGSAGDGRAGWRREAAPPAGARVSGGRRRAVLTLAAGGARSRASGAAAAAARGGRGSHHGGQAAHPHGQREAQQEHHAARERRQDLEDGAGGEGVGRALAAGAVHLRGLRISHLPDHPEHPDGHVRGPAPPAAPSPQRSGARHRPSGIPGPFTSHSEFSSPCHSALNSTTCIKQ